MKAVAERALDTARSRGATYADVRVVRRESQVITVKNGRVENARTVESVGFGVRVLADGAWGFASSRKVTTREADAMAALAVRIARASATACSKPVALGPPIAIRGVYKTPVAQDPFTVPLERKADLLVRATDAMKRTPGVTVAEATCESFRETKTFASSEGSYIEQTLVETGCGMDATAVGHGEVQRRSYPASLGRHQACEGWEFVERQDLLRHAPRIAEEASALLTAPECPPQVTTVILDATQTALQVHESCGHAVELDRALDMEAAFAGTSFLTPDRLGRFRYGSDIVTIVGDATWPGGLGSFGYDDEGVPAQRVPLIDKGMFTGYLSSRETATTIGQKSNGAARADGWNRIPLIRMTNVSLEPGTWRLDDLIADTDDGVYMATNRSWSIDDRRLNFQFGTEIAWEIKKGKRGAMLRNAIYTGITPQFWRSCDAVCDRAHWTVWGIPNCGKGQPDQVAHVGHGAAPARFRNVQVGVRKG